MILYEQNKPLVIPASIHRHRKNTRLECGVAWQEGVDVGMDWYEVIESVAAMDWSVSTVVDTMGFVVRTDMQVVVVYNTVVGRRSSCAKLAAAVAVAAVDCSTWRIMK